jgi:carbamoyl-phosphate synthase small subunit
VTDALLVLEDGSAFRGRSFGGAGEAFGEAVFNTGHTGYQEVLTDPSYAGQIVTMTAAHVGVYGVNPEDGESGGVRVAGFAVRSASRRASSWRATATLAECLAAAGVPAIEGIDTRALALRIRGRGAMRAAVSTVDLDPFSLVPRARAHAGMEGADLAAAVSTPAPYEASDVVGPAVTHAGRTRRVAVLDLGVKRSILRWLAAAGCEAVVYPARTDPSAILDEAFDGVVLSNGPGDPAATTYGVDAAGALVGRVPVLGICLGHQVLALALGGRTFKLPFGHRGVNQPVLDAASGRIAITSHNHGFAVDPEGWGPGSDDRERLRLVESAHGPVVLDRWNLNDGTVEGLRCLDVPALSVQYHPEGAPGPNDALPVFAEFHDLMGRVA